MTRVQPAPRFRDGVQRQPCALCGNTRGFKHAHHILGAAHLRTFVAGLRLPEDEARRRLRALLSDDRNVLALHFRCHLNVEAHFATVPRARLPADVWEFAAELGPWATIRLERMYPTSDRR